MGKTVPVLLVAACVILLRKHGDGGEHVTTSCHWEYPSLSRLQTIMNAAEFAAKWIGNTNTERGAAQEHFIDICTMLGVPTPNPDRAGGAYAFEKGATK